MTTVTPQELLIRELTPANGPAIAFAFGRLSKQSRFQRFMGAKKELSRQELERLTRVDHWHHEALIAFSPLPRAPIGVARYVRCERFDEAEVAIAVVDAWQRRGVGRALVQALRIRALNAGIRRLHATTLPGNAGAHALAQELGAPIVMTFRDDYCELSVDLSA